MLNTKSSYLNIFELIKRIRFLGFVLLMVSCTSSEQKNIGTALVETDLSKYDYSIDTIGVSILWTAYKFTNKTSVYGTFNEINLNRKKVVGPIENILRHLKLSIPTASVDSKNEIRDFKLRTYFFKVFNTPVISGTIIKAKEGEGNVRITMNNISRIVPFTYSLQNENIKFFTHINLKHWDGEKAIKTLNDECYKIDKGPDGVSKLWPEMDIIITLPVSKKLQKKK